MRRFFLSFTAMALMAAVSACSSTPTDEGNVTGSGTTAGRGLPSSSGVMTDAERLAQMQRELQSQVGDRVFFPTDSISLTSEARTTLDRQIAFLKRYPALQLAIQGHADERGTREYNLALGDRRANAVKEYLMANGVTGGRLSTVSFGKERPEAVGANEESWAQNRRAVSVIAR